MPSAEDTDSEIGRLFVEEGLSREAVAERTGLPEAVIDQWVSRNDVDLDEQGSAEGGSDDAEAAGFPGAGDGEVYRCSVCGDVVRVREADEHEARCPPEPDWRRAGR